MLEYMVTGRKPDIPDNDISSIDKILSFIPKILSFIPLLLKVMNRCRYTIGKII